MTSEAPDWPPPGIDTSAPSTARVYDALLGGRDNFQVDREAAEIFARFVPQAKDSAVLNREALVRGVRYLVGRAGIDQILDVGCGLPTKHNTHEAAQEMNPDTRVVYVDNDPMVINHGRALLAADRSTTMITADFRDPCRILGNPEVRAFLDFDRPIALMVVGLTMYLADDERPDEIIAAFMDRLASGSHLFITTWPDTGDPAQIALSRASREALGHGWARPLDSIERHFQGLPMIPPGLEYVSRWYPDEPGKPIPDLEELEPFERTMVAGIAVKP